MNDQQRAAMQMAWEYIDWMLSGNLSEPAHEALDVEAALREALAQPQDNLNCKSVQARLATLWGYVKEQPQGEWVDLTDDDVDDAIDKTYGKCEEPEVTLVRHEFAKALFAKFKEKNTPPVVPQGEPVGYLVYSLDGVSFEDRYCEGAEPVYTTPPSTSALVESAIEATKEKAAKVCENTRKVQYFSTYNKTVDDAVATLDKAAAAIRSME